MLNSLYVAALGMHVQKSQIDTISTNLANANTPGFKRERADFSSVLDHQAVQNTAHAPGTDQPAQTIRRDLTQGVLSSTNSMLDVAINGAGFIEVLLGDDRVGLVRGGSLRINEDGYLTTSDGRVLKSDIRIPANATQLSISAQGVVSAKLGSDDHATSLGQIQLVSFASPESLQYLGGGVYEAAQGQEPMAKSNPEQDGLGSLQAGKLEASNVNIVDEIVGMTMAQRVYELNSKVAQAADELMSMTNNLRKG